jgi:hypothetical protein
MVITSNVKEFAKMSVILISVIVAIAAAIGFSSQYFSGPDNQVEEACEAVIKAETGADIDLSSDSPETTTGATIQIVSANPDDEAV